MSNPGAIPIFTISNRPYLAFVLVMIRSALEHTEKPLIFHILHDDSIKEKDISKFTGLLSGEKNLAGILFRKMEGTEHLKTWGKRFPPLVYYRLLIPEKFPEYEKGIYLDADTLLRGDIALLYEKDLQGNLFGAVEETSRKKDYAENPVLFGKFSQMRLLDYSRKIGLDPEKPYYNSGVLLMDLARIRKEGMESIREALARAGEDLLCPDQDLLNVYFCDRIDPLDPTWNIFIRRDIPSKGNILHYIGKIWHNSSEEIDKSTYFQELRKTPYFYKVRAELILYEIEATINSGWRYPEDNLFKATVKLICHLVAGGVRRAVSFAKNRC